MIYDNIINDHKAKINTEAERIKKIIYTEFPNLSIKLIIKEGFVWTRKLVTACRIYRRNRFDGL